MDNVVETLAGLNLNTIGCPDADKEQKRTILNDIRKIPENFRRSVLDAILDEDVEAFNEEMIKIQRELVGLFTSYGKHGSLNCGTNFTSYKEIREAGRKLYDDIDTTMNYAIVLQFILAPLFALPTDFVIRPLDKPKGEKTFSKMCLNLAIKLALDKHSYISGYWDKAQTVNYD